MATPAGFVLVDLPPHPGGNHATLERGVYRVSLKWDGMTFGVQGNLGSPKPGTYQLDVGNHFYANARKGMEESSLHEV
jgi:hypothetical protein